MIGLITIKIWPTFWIQSPNLQFLALLTTISQNHRALNVLSRLYTILMTIHILLPSLRKLLTTYARWQQNIFIPLSLCLTAFFFFFYLQRSVDRTNNEEWFNNCKGQRFFIRRGLGILPASTLNIYTCQFQDRLLGDASFPWSDLESGLSHGVAIHYETLPGGAMLTLNLGDNAVHEVNLSEYKTKKRERELLSWASCNQNQSYCYH